MPKTSKIRSASTKPKKAPPLEEERTSDFYCCRCKRHFKKQKGNFPASQSPLYDGNGKYLATCNHCVDELFQHYKAALADEAEAIKRICLKFDIYWNPEIYAMLNKTSTAQSRVRAYISKTNLYKYIGKTFDDTLDEEYQAELDRLNKEKEKAEKEKGITVDYLGGNGESSNSQNSDSSDAKKENKTAKISVPKRVVEYWGVGMSPETYLNLENRRKYWMNQFPPDTVLSPGEEALLRQICILETNINKDLAAGNSIEKSTNALNSLLGSMNIKPSQKKTTEDNVIPFGCEIARFEDENPIIEPDDEFKDVDNIRKNVITWFLGSLCKTAGIKNEYSDLFEEEIKKYTVERPQYGEEDDIDDEEEGGAND